MSWVTRRGNRNDGMGIGNPVCSRDYCSAAETVPDQDGGRATGFPQIVGSGDKVINVRRKMCVGEFSFACAKARKIEAQDANSGHRQSFGNPLGREIVLAASETMGKEGEGIWFSERQIYQRRELLSLGIGKFQLLGTHFALQPLIRRGDMFAPHPADNPPDCKNAGRYEQRGGERNVDWC